MNLRYLQIFLKELAGSCEARAYPTCYLDETTDVTKCSQLLICVRKQRLIQRRIPFCKPPAARTDALVVFNVVRDFLIVNYQCAAWRMNLMTFLC